ARDRDHVDGFRLMGVDVDGEPEVGRQVAAHLTPVLAGVVGSHHVPVLLHEERVRLRRVHGEPVDAVADLGGRVGDLRRVEAVVDRLPTLPRVVAAKGTGGRDGGVDAIGIGRVELYRVQAEAAGAGCPGWRGSVRPEPVQLLPGLPAVGRPEEGRVLYAGVDSVGVGEARLQVPDTGEDVRVRRAVVPGVGADLAFVAEVVADRFPGLTAVVRALHDLPEPAARLRRVEPVRVQRRPV